MGEKIENLKAKITKAITILETNPIENMELYSKEEREQTIKVAIETMQFMLRYLDEQK